MMISDVRRWAEIRPCQGNGLYPRLGRAGIEQKAGGFFIYIGRDTFSGGNIGRDDGMAGVTRFMYLRK